MLTVWLSIATLIALLSVGDAPVPVDAPARNNGDEERGDVVRVEDISPQGDLEDPRDPYVSINPYELLSRMEESNFDGRDCHNYEDIQAFLSKSSTATSVRGGMGMPKHWLQKSNLKL